MVDFLKIVTAEQVKMKRLISYAVNSVFHSLLGFPFHLGNIVEYKWRQRERPQPAFNYGDLWHVQMWL